MAKVKIEVQGQMVDRRGPTVEVLTEIKRGEVWLRHQAKNVLAGESLEIEIGPRTRVMVNDLSAVEEAVYDRDQGAAILPSRSPNPDVPRAGEAQIGPQTPTERTAAEQEHARRTQDAKVAGIDPPPPLGSRPGTVPAGAPQPSASADLPVLSQHSQGPLAKVQTPPPSTFKPLQPNPNKPVAPVALPTAAPPAPAPQQTAAQPLPPTTPPPQPAPNPPNQSSAGGLQSSKDVKLNEPPKQA